MAEKPRHPLSVPAVSLEATLRYALHPYMKGWQICRYVDRGWASIQVASADGGAVYLTQEWALARATELALAGLPVPLVVDDFCCLDCKYNLPAEVLPNGDFVCLGCNAVIRAA